MSSAGEVAASRRWPNGAQAGSSSAARVWTALLCATVAGMILASRTLSLMAAPSPWSDEAMISANLVLIPWSDILRPLPLYDQAAPLGYVVLGKVVSGLAGPDFLFAMRVCAVAMSLGCAALYFRAVDMARPRAEAALATALLMLSPAFVFHGVEIKHYGIEALATAAVMAAGMNAIRSRADLGSLAMFAAAAAAGLVVSLTAVVVIAGFGAALWVFAALEQPRASRKLVLIAAVGLMLAAVEACVYFGYAQQAVALQLEAYKERYAVGRQTFPPLTSAELERWQYLLRLMIKAYVGPTPAAQVVFGGLCAIGCAAGLTSPSRATRFLVIAGAFTLLATACAAIFGVFTPKRLRHVLFLAPITALLLTLGMSTLAGWLARLLPATLRPRITAAVLSAVILAYGAQGLASSAAAEREPLGRMLARVQKDGGWPGETWVYYAAQPAVDMLTYPRIEPFLGRVPRESSRARWSAPVEADYAAYMARFEREMAGRGRIYILFSHVAQKRVTGLVEAAERRVGPCRRLDYAPGRVTPASAYRCDRAASTQTRSDSASAR